MENGVVEFACRTQQPVLIAGRNQCSSRCGLRFRWRSDVDGGRAQVSIDGYLYRSGTCRPIDNRVGFERAFQWGECNTGTTIRSVGVCKANSYSCRDEFIERTARGDVIDEIPVERRLSSDTLSASGEGVGKIAAHMALLDDPSQAACAWQYCQQRNLGK